MLTSNVFKKVGLGDIKNLLNPSTNDLFDLEVFQCTGSLSPMRKSLSYCLLVGAQLHS